MWVSDAYTHALPYNQLQHCQRFASSMVARQLKNIVNDQWHETMAN